MRAAGHGDRNAHQAADFQRLTDQLSQRFDGQRLEHEIVGAQRHGLNRRVARIHRRDEDHGDFRVQGMELVKGFQARQLGQHDVQQHGVRLALAQQTQPVLDGCRLDHFNVGTGQRLAHEVPNRTIVIDH